MSEGNSFYTIALEQAALELNATGYFQKQQELQMNATVTCTQMETKSRSTTRLDEKIPMWVTTQQTDTRAPALGLPLILSADTSSFTDSLDTF